MIVDVNTGTAQKNLS